MTQENNGQKPAFRVEAEEYANRIIAFEWRQNAVKKDIAGDWEAGYVFGYIDGKKEAAQPPSPLPAGEQQQVGEWQLCPKCNGDGHLGRYNSPGLSTTTHPLCDVCTGAKILMKPVISSTTEGAGEMDWVEMVLNWHKKFGVDIDEQGAFGGYMDMGYAGSNIGLAEVVLAIAKNILTNTKIHSQKTL